MTFELQASLRDATGKGVARKLRAAGSIPAVCYGQEVEAPMPLTIRPESIISLFDNPKGRNVVFNLVIDGGKTIKNVMVKDYDLDPIRRDLLHVDFQVVDMERPIVARVPIEPVGRAAGTRIGGVLSLLRTDIDVKARPAHIPAKIEVDVTELTAGQTILAADVSLPEGVEPGYRANYGMMRIIMPRKKVEKVEDDKKKKK